jgi:DNA (cytosine-5)-methyltransferase 1
MKKRIAIIDVFCGVGGLSYGFKQAGYKIKAGIDSDPSCRYAFETNISAPFLARDVSSISGAELNRIFGDRRRQFRVLIGCAPCQPFSIYTGRYKKARKIDNRWQLLLEFGRLVSATRPHIVSMENVGRLTKHAAFKRFVRQLVSEGYHVTYKKLRAEHYGVPQRRTRLVLLASSLGEIVLPPPSHTSELRTVRDAIGHLPSLRAGTSHAKDRLHTARGLTPINAARLRATREGGSWKDWDPALRLSCHKKARGKSFRSVYGRMKWDEPAPVITTQCLGIGNGRFGHPEQNRAISIREAALLQSFPQKFRFLKPGKKINGLALARQIGNAVPVKLGNAIAKAITKHLSSVTAI